MRGEFIGVWAETWHEIWFPLMDEPLSDNEEGVPFDLFCELYRELAKALKAQPSIEALADIIDDPVQSREAFEKTTEADLAGERAVVTFLEAAHPALDDLVGDELSNRYFNLLTAFIDKFSLRYDLRCPCTLCPTLPGMFTALLRELDALSTTDQNIDKRLRDFKEAIQDLRMGPTGRAHLELRNEAGDASGSSCRSFGGSCTLGPTCAKSLPRGHMRRSRRL